MTFVINVIEWLLWTVETICIKQNLLSRFCGLSTLPANTTLNNAGPMLTHCLRSWPSIKPALAQRLVFAGLHSIAAGMVLLPAGGNHYKPTLTQCLLNVGPISSVLASIHSVLVSTSFCRCRHAGSTGTML